MAPFNLLTVKEFMENNDEIPWRVLEDLQKELRKPRQELADLEAEIKDLEGQLTKLKLKRSQVEKHLAQYDCVLSPIRRLPADILHDIFYHCLPTRRDPIMNAREAPLLLTRICRSWRQIAHSSPRLWTRLYITFADEDVVEEIESQIEYRLTSHIISGMLRTRCSAVEEWLSRSGALPLSISICYSSCAWLSDPNYSSRNSENTRTLFEILARFSPRWQRLELRMSLEIYRILEGMLSVSKLPILTSVRTSFFRQFDLDVASQVESDVVVLQAQDIQRISITSDDFTFRTVLSSPNLAKLTSFAFHGMIHTTQAISFLRNCPNLEYLWLNFMSSAEWPLGPSHPTPSLISLPHLRALCAADSILWYTESKIYECIDAPQLEWVDFTKQTGAPDTLDAFITLLQKSKKLRKLTIVPNLLTTSHLRRMLKSAPDIRHLVLGAERRIEENLLAPALLLPTPLGGNTTWNFRDLFLENNEQEIAGDGRSPLVPRLEILEVSHGGSTHITDEMLLDVILHREDLAGTKDVALLKTVVVLFTKPQELNIADEYCKRSTSTSGKIDMRLEYPDNHRPQIVHSVSAGFGMDDLGRSWNFRDIEEEMVS